MIERVMQPALAHVARAILRKHCPLVVGISGSVGKTSTKDAVSCVLSAWRPTVSSPENQNDELGVPLSIIGVGPSGRNLLGWLATFGRAQRILASRDGSYPVCLVLEFGSCHVGDVEYLMRLAKPEVGVLTAIEATHLQFYDSIEAIELEEGKVVTMLPPSGTGIVNIDNPGAAAAAGRASCRIVTYGFAAGADVRGLAAISSIDWGQGSACTHLDVQRGEERGTLTIDGVLGNHSCYAPLAALAVAQAVGIPFARALHALGAYVPPAGRMRCRRGLRGSLVVDDTYNSSPAAAMRALDALAAVASGDSIAVLGPMAELGLTSESRHEAVGRHAASVGLDWLVTVGDEAAQTARSARRAGLPGNRVIACSETEEAIQVVNDRATPGCVVLVKGSQSSRLDRVADALADERPKSTVGTRVEARA